MAPPRSASTGAPVLTTSTIPPAGEIEILGLVCGASVHSRHLVSDLGATLKNTLGGELKTYTALLEIAFNQALDRLREKAADLGADGVFGIQVGCPEIAAGAAEVLLVGTAYRLKVRRPDEEPGEH